MSRPAAPSAIATAIASAQRADDAAERWSALRQAASDRYRRDPRDPFARHFAKGKLRYDPVFRHLLATGVIPPRARVLDIGCGQGLVAALLLAAGEAAAARRWPAGWADAPHGARVTGIELMPRDAARARSAVGDAGEVVCGDLRETPFPASDVILLLDVLHYIGRDAQDRVLERARRALPAGGRLVLRVGDAAAGSASRRSLWVDRLVAAVRRRERVPLCVRELSAWTQRLEALGFAVDACPMSQGTPFANVLLVGRRPAPAAFDPRSLGRIAP